MSPRGWAEQIGSTLNKRRNRKQMTELSGQIPQECDVLLTQLPPQRIHVATWFTATVISYATAILHAPMTAWISAATR